MNVFPKIKLTIKTEFKVAVLTFELFWIAIVLLDKLGNASGGGVPKFVYVNF